jgi:outer membrane receptor protein involved in Fe transport
VELEMNTRWKGARLEAGYSYLDARDRSTDETLLGRPRHSARAHAGYTLASGTRFGLTGIFTGQTPLRRNQTAVLYRDAYARVDARIAQTLLQTVELSLGANNLFDRKPADWPGYTGRQIYIGAAWRPTNIQEGM